MTCGGTGALAIGLAATAGAARLVTARGDAFCIVAFIACPETPWIADRSAAIKNSTEN
jgi:hypothetical protein